MKIQTFLIAAGVALALTAGPARANDADKASFENAVRTFLLEHPEVVAEALEKYQAIEAAAAAERQKEAARALAAELRADARVPRIGAAAPRVTMVEFFDYNCGYCRRVAGDLARLVDEIDDLEILLVELPILSEGSMEAAQVALAAHEQGAYWTLHLALLQARGQANAETALALAEANGLDVDRLRAAMGSDAQRALLAANVERARAVQVRGTPAFVIGDRVIPGAVPYEELKAAIDAARG